jgi:hypothetical protein
MGWYRDAWPEGPLQGQFQVSARMLSKTGLLLRRFRGGDGPHEGLVFWGGRETSALTQYVMAESPECDHSYGRVQADEAQVFQVVRKFRRRKCGLLAQVHSHPGPEVRHSYGDDQRVFLPFEGMLSIVVPRYGSGGPLDLALSGIHQYQRGRWVHCTSEHARIHVTR